MNLGFLGTGTIATAVVHALAPEGHNILVSERSAANASALESAYENVTTGTNAEVTTASDVLFLGLMPNQTAPALAGLPFRADQRVISFIADISLTEIASLTAPAKVETLVLPFPAIAKGRSPLIAFPQSQLADNLFQNHDVFNMTSETEFKAFLSAQAVLSPVAQMLAEATGWAATKGADTAKAEAFLRSLVASNLTAGALTPLLKSLSTTGGYNARLRQHLEDNSSYKTLREGLDQL